MSWKTEGYEISFNYRDRKLSIYMLMWKHLLHSIKYIKNLKTEECISNGEQTSVLFLTAISVFDQMFSSNN